jgi:hypothetical protein
MKLFDYQFVRNNFGVAWLCHAEPCSAVHAAWPWAPENWLWRFLIALPFTIVTTPG